MEMLLTIEQTATRLQLHPDTVRRQLVRGVLRGVKRGRQWRVPESALIESMPSAPTNRAAAIERGFGFLKGKARSSDDFLAERHAEARAETEKDETRARRQSTDVPA
jgi:excisionase family DNA binding protein